MLHVLSKENSIVNSYVAQLRDVEVQSDRARFRRNLGRVGTMAAYEISKTLSYEATEVETPLGIDTTSLPTDRIVLATILRAGLPLYEGMLDVFDDADSAFASAYRRHHKDGSFDINMPYITCPPLDGAVLMLADPMIATGASIDSCLSALAEYGKPKVIHIVTVIASIAAVEYLKRKYPKVHLWAAAVDDELTAKSYIVPGLGDAGDLAYGSKMQD